MRRENSRIKPTLTSDPTKAAAIMAKEETLPNHFMQPIMAKATAILALLEMPSTKGPATGLAKKVCSRKPDNASAPPRMAAIKIRGSRIFQMMFTWVILPVLVNSIFKISSTGMATLPMRIFRIIISRKAASRDAKTVTTRIVCFFILSPDAERSCHLRPRR